MRAAPKRRSATRRIAARSSRAARSTAAAAEATPSTRKPVVAHVDDLGHRPPRVGNHRRPAGHRLDHRQPERLVEGNGVQQRRSRAEHLRAALGSDRAQVGDAIAVDVGLHLLRESTPRPERSRRGRGGGRRAERCRSRWPFPCRGGFDRTRPAASPPAAENGKALQVDAVMDGRQVVELRGAVRVGDRDVGRGARVHVRGQNPPPGEAVNRRDERRFDSAGRRRGEASRGGCERDRTRLNGRARGRRAAPPTPARPARGPRRIRWRRPRRGPRPSASRGSRRASRPRPARPAPRRSGW